MGERFRSPFKVNPIPHSILSQALTYIHHQNHLHQTRYQDKSILLLQSVNETRLY